MKFTSSRNLVLAAYGHVVTFAKGDTLFVPPALHQAALEQGLEPVLADGEQAPEQAPKMDDSARIEAVKDAMRAIASRNDAGDFDAGGVPKAKAIRAITGGHEPVDAKERTTLWAQVINSIEG